MTLEHDQECALIEDIEKDLRLAKLSECVACANKLSSTLRNHIYEEDHILFETVDAVLSAKEVSETSSDVSLGSRTMVIVHLAAKRLAAMTLAIAHSRDWLDYEERVCTY